LTTEQIRPLTSASSRKQRLASLGLFLGLALIVSLLGLLVYAFLRPETPVETVERWRDLLIIIVALESLVIGVALVVLIVQLAGLINLIQNELRPILRATSDTVNTLRGTGDFLGENLIRPVIELRGYLAGITRMLELLRLKRR
jgi:uncharacterized membrane protein